MFSRTHKKAVRNCPACGSVVNLSRSDVLQYIFAYRPFRCAHCSESFDTNNISKFLMFLMASAVIYLAINIEGLREIQRSEPDLQLYLIGGTVVVTWIVALILIRLRYFVVRDGPRPIAVFLHYATLIAMPFSLLLFAYMAQLHGA